MRFTTGASIAALAFGFSLATPVLAADYGPGRDRHDQPAAQQQQQDQNDQSNDKGDKGDRTRQHHDNGKPQGTPKPSGMNKTDWQNNNNRGQDDHGNANDNRNRWNNNNVHRGDDFNRNHRNDGDWKKGRAKVDISVYRRNVTSPHRYRIGVYHAPRGYYYRRWHYGERLPVAFYARDYWLLDFIAFGLFAPPPGYEWVRYGDDALLIDVETGEIIQVRYDVFYS